METLTMTAAREATESQENIRFICTDNSNFSNEELRTLATCAGGSRSGNGPTIFVANGLEIV